MVKEKTICQKKLDTLGQLFTKMEYGIYNFGWAVFPSEKYKDLPAKELKNLGFPTNRGDLRVFQFETYIDTLFNKSNCNCEWTNEAIMKTVGHPTDIEYDGSYVYKLDYGKACPCGNCPILNVFDGCTAFVIRFNKKGCIQGKVNFRK